MSVRRRAWLTLGAVVVGGAGVVTVAVANPPENREPSVAASPVRVHSVKLQAKGNGKEEVARRDTRPFSLLGISWPRATAEIDGRAEIRTRSIETGEWSPWRELGLDLHVPEGEEGREAQARGATEPRWVGPSDGVEARVVSDDGRTTAGLPDGMRLDLVDPGVTKREAKNADAAASGTDMEPAAYVANDPTGTPLEPSVETTTPAPSTEPSDTPTTGPAPSDSAPADPTTDPGGSPSPTDGATTDPSPTPTVPTAPESTVTRPPIVSRAAWGADESLAEDPPEYLEGVKAVFVHHTTDANAYSCSQSPAIVRAIMAYHIESNGWNDLGYNFLVDKCGTVFEGRRGGVDLPVRGAHTYGFNGDSTGIAVIGNYATDGVPTRTVLNAVSRVAAWKLGQYGVNPAGKVTLTAAGDTGVWKTGEQATLDTISGHRDGFATECPGDALYTKLSEIRRFAASPAASSAAPTADVNRDGMADMAAGAHRAAVGGKSGAGTVTVVPGGVDGPVAASRITLSQSSPGVVGAAESGDNFGEATAYGDVNGDGHADLVVGIPGEDDSVGHTDAGGATILYGPAFDRSNWLEAATADRVSGARFGSTIAVGDFDSDGHADVFTASRKGPAGWWAFDGADRGVRKGTLQAASGTISHLASATGDFNRDGYADVVLNHRDSGGIGRLTLLNGSAEGLKYVGLASVKGGRSVAAGDINGDGHADLVVGQPYASESGAYSGGQITVLPGSASGPTTTGRKVFHQNTSGVPGAAEAGDAMGWSVATGDVNGDGRDDVLTGLAREDLTRDGVNRKDAGMALLFHGTSSGLGTSGAQTLHQDVTGMPGASETGDHLGSESLLADLSGWGRADLAIGADGEDTNDGTILQLDAGSTGVSPSGGVYYTLSKLGLPADVRLGGQLAP
ncbi:FG-GAP-like repeat-containing protein [Streptomyces macrosporus]|uniref:Peptidoglycan recognition protein family domain-containing protein n=1 Tax=Streptomyces macrosporus TaxID=44032 RepID=A0ABN3K8A0_9ACTN